MEVNFQADFRTKLLSVSFSPGTKISKAEDVASWRAQWTAELKKWHAPYKAIIDCRDLAIAPEDGELAAVEKQLRVMFAYLKGFFLRKAAGFGGAGDLSLLPFEVFSEEEEARRALGLREQREAKVAGEGEWRKQILIDNHFQQQIVEISFQRDFFLDTNAKLVILNDKIMNNLMLWHSAWTLLIDCSHLQMSEEIADKFQKRVKAWNGLFLKQVLGFMPQRDCQYPFSVYRSRHLAMAKLDKNVAESGDTASCQDRKVNRSDS